jgi:hypothetical protein
MNVNRSDFGKDKMDSIQRLDLRRKKRKRNCVNSQPLVSEKLPLRRLEASACPQTIGGRLEGKGKIEKRERLRKEGRRKRRRGNRQNENENQQHCHLPTSRNVKWDRKKKLMLKRSRTLIKFINMVNLLLRLRTFLLLLTSKLDSTVQILILVSHRR